MRRKGFHYKSAFAGLLIIVSIFNLVLFFYHMKTNSAIVDMGRESNVSQKNTNKKNDTNVIGKNTADTTNTDTEYKMFYGEWKISKIIGHSQTTGMSTDEEKSFLGKTVTYTIGDIIYDNKEIIQSPEYRYVILPVTPNKEYIEKSLTLKELGITGNYFVYVSVNTIVNNEIIDFIGSEFFIKDDSTLIAENKGVFFELKRASYIEGAELQKTQV